VRAACAKNLTNPRDDDLASPRLGKLSNASRTKIDATSHDAQIRAPDTEGSRARAPERGAGFERRPRRSSAEPQDVFDARER
jgi:hypothetical protein